MWEYLSLYSERDDGNETFTVKHYPERGNKITEAVVLDQLGTAGWELVAVVPAYGGGGVKINHQLYFKRAKGDQPTTRLDPIGGEQ